MLHQVKDFHLLGEIYCFQHSWFYMVLLPFLCWYCFVTDLHCGKLAASFLYSPGVGSNKFGLLTQPGFHVTSVEGITFSSHRVIQAKSQQAKYSSIVFTSFVEFVCMIHVFLSWSDVVAVATFWGNLLIRVATFKGHAEFFSLNFNEMTLFVVFFYHF